MARTAIVPTLKTKPNRIGASPQPVYRAVRDLLATGMFLGKKKPRREGAHGALGLPNAKTPETGASGAFKAMNSQVTRTMHRPVQLGVKPRVSSIPAPSGSVDGECQGCP